jgi:hypothetical protein
MNTPQTWSDSPIHEQIRTMNDTPTPRTNDIIEQGWQSINYPSRPIPAEFAQQLERELTAVTAQRDDLQMQLDSSCNAEELRQFRAERDEARVALAEIEAKMRGELGGHPDSELWGDAGLIAATMRCVDALGEITEQRDAVTLRLGNTQERMIDAERQRDRLAEEVGQLKSQLTQTMGAVTISRNGYVQELEQQRDRLAEALRELCIALLTDKSPDITDLLNKAGAAMAAVNYSNIGKPKS